MFKIALCQMLAPRAKSTEEYKQAALAGAERLVREAALGGADIAVLPEMWLCPYSNKCFPDFCEPAGGRAYSFLSGLAEELGIYIVGGTFPEEEDGRIYNTCFVFDRDGKLIARHRKTFLFDVDIPGKISFKESTILSAGDRSTVFDTEFGRMGVAICFDVRFGSFIAEEADAGAKLIFLPASFNMTTGPAHWDITMRMRAIDNQIFFAACAPARNTESSYVAYANSCVTGPWGDVIAHADTEETVLYADIDFDKADKVRRELPIFDNPKRKRV